MCQLTAEERRLLEAGMTASQHIVQFSALLDVQANRARSWKRFYDAAQRITGLRDRFGLEGHPFTLECCYPPGADVAMAAATLAVVVYGLNPFEADLAREQIVASIPPKKAKNEEEVRERTRESRERMQKLLVERLQPDAV